MEHQPFKDRLLICDMDGTLLDSCSRLSMENKTALDRFVAGGGFFTVATGRMEKSVMQYLKDLPVNLPAIVYNGAAIYDFQKDRILWQDNLVPGVIEPVREVMERFPEIGVEFYHGGMTYFVRENRYTYEHMLREKFDPIITAVDDVPQPWYKVILAWDPCRLPEVESFLMKYRTLFSQVYSEPHFLELLNLKTSKGNALKMLIEMLGLNQTFVIAMGDNLNDMELIREADVGIATDNAHTSLKAAADLCCSHHDLNAVSEVISWIESGKISY